MANHDRPFLGENTDIKENMTVQKIAFYIPSFDGGGAERVMVNLANGMAERPDIDVDFIVTQKIGPLEGDVSEKVNLVNLNSKRIITSLVPLTTYIRKKQPDFLVSALNTANIVSILAKLLSLRKTILLVTVHNTLSMAASNPKFRRTRLIPKLMSSLFPIANGIVTVSKGVAEDLASVTGLNRDSIEVIYNPVITPEVRTLSQQPCTDAWVNDPTTPTLLGIGRLSPQKDFANLLEAVAIVVKQRPVKLIILGEGDLREDLEAQIADLKLTQYVKMPGFVKNPYSYMKNADLFVLSSQWEGLPTVLIESLFCNTKLVSTDCPSGPKEILAAGRYGLLVKPKDPTDLARGILETLDNNNVLIPDESWERYTLEYSISHYLSYMIDKNSSSKLTAVKG